MCRNILGYLVLPLLLSLIIYFISSPGQHVIEKGVAGAGSLLVNMIDSSKKYAITVLSNQTSIITIAKAADYFGDVLDNALSVLVAVAYNNENNDFEDDYKNYVERAKKLVHGWTTLRQNAWKLVNRQYKHVEMLTRELPASSKLLSHESTADASQNDYIKSKQINMEVRWGSVVHDFEMLVQQCENLIYDADDLCMFVQELIAEYKSGLTRLDSGPARERQLFIFTVMLLVVAAPVAYVLELSATTSVALSGALTAGTDMYRKYIADPALRQQLEQLIEFYSGEALVLRNFSSSLKSYELVLDEILTEVTSTGVTIQSFSGCNFEYGDIANNYCFQTFLSQTLDDLNKVKAVYKRYIESESDPELEVQMLAEKEELQ